MAGFSRNVIFDPVKGTLEARLSSSDAALVIQ
jgi:hypothetical protein